MTPDEKMVNNVSVKLGFEVNPASMISAESTMATAFLPFFNRSIEDQSTWTNDAKTIDFKFDNLNNISKRGGRARFPNIRSLFVITNPDTQQILKVASDWPVDAPSIAAFPDAAEEEKQLLMKGERFIALPTQSPPIDFYMAMKKLDIAGPVSPTKAKQVIAYLVVHSTKRYTDRMVWNIQTRGIDLEAEGYTSHRHNVPADARNHMRHIVDAITGEWLFSDTTPQPV